MKNKYIMTLLKNYYELKSKKVKLMRSYGKEFTDEIQAELELLNEELNSINSMIKAYSGD